jgi:hypothetical protein
MNPNWQEFLGASGAHVTDGQVVDFGDPAAELTAAREATIMAPLGHLGLLECAGEDAKSFLHNQLTSDVNHLTPGFAQHSAWCSAKGRMLVSFLFYRRDADFRALLSADLLAAMQKRLQMYVLRSKVKINDLSDRCGTIGLSGPQAEAALRGADLPAPVETMQTMDFAGGTVIRIDTARFIIVAAGESAAELWNKLAETARPVGTPVWRWLEIQAGIPLITEATKEAFVPQMANFDKIGGVSFHKGCYPGQEVVARTQYLGKVKRHLYRIHTDAAVANGAPIHTADDPEHPSGMVCNVAPAPGGGFDALAVIQENFVAPGDPGLLVAGGQLASIELVGA